MPFVKLDCGILDSTIWVDRPAREIFITALLMAEPASYDEPVAQIAVRTLDLTGWAAPPGNYGLVPAAGVGIVARCGMDQELGLAALERLGAQEPDSRSREYEGRRLVRVDGGYLVLNYARYRDRDYNNAARQKRWREKQKAKSNGVMESRNPVTNGKVTHAYAYADADADADADAPKEQNSVAPKRTATGSRIPDDFDLTSIRRGIAITEGLDADRTFADFRDYWLAASGQRARKMDWDATWRVWCRNQRKPRAAASQITYQIPDA